MVIRLAVQVRAIMIGSLVCLLLSIVTRAAEIDARRRAVWIANALYRVNNDRRYEEIVLLNYLRGAYQEDPKLQPNAALQVLTAARDQYSAHPTTGVPYDSINSMFAILSVDPKWGKMVPIAKEFLNWARQGLQGAVNSSERIL
jgi:hypothetical protein